MKIFIKRDEVYTKPLKYILSVLSKNKSIPVTFSQTKTDAQLIFDHTDSTSIAVNSWFYETLLKKKIFRHENYFTANCYILFPETKKQDYLATAFYMINCFQEYDNHNVDKYGRYQFSGSYQNKFNCIEKNIVQACFDSFCNEYPVFGGSLKSDKKTKVFLSHDIDSIYGSFLQDGLWAIKKGRLDVILKLVMSEILLKPNWKNIDKIVKLHSEHDLKSTFFWLATQKIDSNKVKNADYSINKLGDLLSITKSNGLHKSCMSYSFDEELDMLPFKTNLNRYHFLKFAVPTAWENIQNSKINFDASLGFAERYGFRNSYGLPFKPYNIDTGEEYSFIETPLNVMDGTLYRYMKVPKNKTAQGIIDFIEKNKTNCIISILWHNPYFTNHYKYGGYLEEYKKVLLYLNEEGIKSITPDEIINEF